MGDFGLELKSFRLLHLSSRFQNGQMIRKSDVAEEFRVTERSIQRDIEDLRSFFAQQIPAREIIYDARFKAYRLTENDTALLSNSETLAVCKILLESRSMVREEMFPILDKLISSCVPKHHKKAVSQLIANEKHHYIEPHHGELILGGLWEISLAVQHQKVMEFQYERLKVPTLVTRKVEPVGIMFSEYYFYLVAFLRDVDKENHFENKNDLFPTIYRIDRIRSFKVLNEHFFLPYKERFEEGEFRKRVQFMHGGRLEHIKFRYTGPSLESVLDRLPTAQAVEECEGGWTIKAEVFGKGVDMWLRSQGGYVQVCDGENLSTETPLKH